jgi:hypothetical protein
LTAEIRGQVSTKRQVSTIMTPAAATKHAAAATRHRMPGTECRPNHARIPRHAANSINSGTTTGHSLTARNQAFTASLSLSPADECAYSSWKSMMKEHIHPVLEVIMADEDGASVVSRHSRE